MNEESIRPQENNFQFDLQSLLWLTTTIGFCLAFLRTYGSQAVVEGIVVIASSAVLGLVIGTMRKRRADVVYWCVLGGIVAFMSVTGAALPHWSAKYAWVITGAFSGAMIGSVPDHRPILTIVIGTLSATIVVGIHAVYVYSQTEQFFPFDVICSVLAGAIFGAIVVVLRWMERRQILRRDSSAALLMLLVLIANIVDRWMAP